MAILEQNLLKWPFRQLIRSEKSHNMIVTGTRSGLTKFSCKVSPTVVMQQHEQDSWKFLGWVPLVTHGP